MRCIHSQAHDTPGCSHLLSHSCTHTLSFILAFMCLVVKETSPEEASTDTGKHANSTQKCLSGLGIKPTTFLLNCMNANCCATVPSTSRHWSSFMKTNFFDQEVTEDEPGVITISAGVVPKPGPKWFLGVFWMSLCSDFTSAKRSSSDGAKSLKRQVPFLNIFRAILGETIYFWVTEGERAEDWYNHYHHFKFWKVLNIVIILHFDGWCGPGRLCPNFKIFHTVCIYSG